MNQRTPQPYISSEEFLSWPFANWPSLKSLSSQSSGLSLWEEEGEIVVEAALPGIKSENINIVFEKGTLTIQGSKKEEKDDKAKKYYHKSDTSFEYALKVPGEIDDHQEPHATLTDGVLQIRFKKHQRSTPRKISVKTS